MPLDPSLFLQGAQLQAQNDAQTRATIANVFDKLAATKERQRAEEKALATDYEGSMMRVLTAQAAGQQPDPADLIRAQAFDRFNMAQNAVNPATGDPFPKNSSILGNLQNAGGAAYPQGGLYGPPSMQTGGFVPPDAAANMAKMTLPNSPYNNDLGNINDAVPPLGDNYMEVAGMTPGQRTQQRMGTSLPAPSNTKQAQTTFEATTDIAKESEIDANKQKTAQELDAAKVRKSDIDTLPILQDMIALNEKTVNIPYAGSGPVKFGTRMADFATGENTTGPMDLLQQNRLDLAAPLAKQLGVNPTDKDFQASLDRIFDANASKESRRDQINNLIKKIKRRQNLKQRGFEDTTNTEPPPQSNAVSYEEYFK